MPADGYTLLLVNSQNAINVALYETLSFDFVRLPQGLRGGWLDRFRRSQGYAARDHRDAQ